MPTEHNTSEEDHGHDDVRRLLKGLPKAKAPWHFEADLQRRLVKKKSAVPATVWGPVSAYVVPAVVLFIVGVIGYTRFFVQEQTHIGEKIKEVPVAAPEHHTAQTPAVQPSPALPVPPPVQQEVAQPGSGPFTPSTNMVQESRPLDRTAPSYQEDETDGRIPETQFVPTPSLQEMGIQARPVGLRSFVGPMYIVDSAVTPAARDSLDSLRVGADSLHKNP